MTAPWVFELRFASATGIDVAQNPGQVGQELTPRKLPHPILLKIQEGIVDRMNRPRFVISAQGFSSHADAHAAGKRLQSAILIGAAMKGTGAGFGPEFVYLSVFTGRLETHWFDPPPRPSILAADFAELIDAGMDRAASLTERQRISAELLNDSQFKLSDDARFLLRIAAIEVLCPQTDLGAAFCKLVDQMLATAPAGASEEHASVISRALGNAKRKSVRSACLSRIEHLLGATAVEHSTSFTNCGANSCTKASGAET